MRAVAPIFRIGRLRRSFALLLGTAISAYSTTVVPPEFPTLVNDSDYIVHAVTKSVTAEKRTGLSGRSKIVTRVEFEVVEVIAGKPPATLTLEFLGGRVGGETMTVGGMPQFKTGDEDILFVSDNGRSICPLYGMMHGRYGVVTDPAGGRKYVARSDGTPLQRTTQISSPLETGPDQPDRRRAAQAAALAPSDFIREIRASVRPNARVTREK